MDVNPRNPRERMMSWMLSWKLGSSLFTTPEPETSKQGSGVGNPEI